MVIRCVGALLMMAFFPCSRMQLTQSKDTQSGMFSELINSVLLFNLETVVVHENMLGP